LRALNRKAIQALAELRLESLVLTERVDNALKLIGDLYLARVHAVGVATYLQIGRAPFRANRHYRQPISAANRPGANDPKPDSELVIIV
jgi:hypothetical protein